MKPPIYTGRTVDGKEVYFMRLFQWKDQEGLPIDISVYKAAQHNIIPSWIYEVEGALWLGWTRDKIVNELREVFTILYPEKRGELIDAINSYFEVREMPNNITPVLIKMTKP